MNNIKEVELCCDCNGELLSWEKWVCTMCRRMIKEYEKEHEDDVE